MLVIILNYCPTAVLSVQNMFFGFHQNDINVKYDKRVFTVSRVNIIDKPMENYPPWCFTVTITDSKKTHWFSTASAKELKVNTCKINCEFLYLDM